MLIVWLASKGNINANPCQCTGNLWKIKLSIGYWIKYHTNFPYTPRFLQKAEKNSKYNIIEFTFYYQKTWTYDINFCRFLLKKTMNPIDIRITINQTDTFSEYNSKPTRSVSTEEYDSTCCTIKEKHWVKM